MAAPSSSKKRKISELRNAVPFCSQSALSSICQEIEKHGMPQQPSENNALLESDGMSRYGPLLNSVEPHLEEGPKRGSSISAKEGERVRIFYVNFLSLLAGVFYKNSAFAEYMLKLHSLRPSSISKPWRLCI